MPGSAATVTAGVTISQPLAVPMSETHRRQQPIRKPPNGHSDVTAPVLVMPLFTESRNLHDWA